MIKITVVIPVYNTEKYLKECINSLLNQTLKEIEFIFVNDGSTDSSQSIIESYQKNDSRITLVNQQNQGVSVARNRGIEKAQGEFIAFVDSDDYVKNDMYEALYNNAVKANADIVVSSFFKEIDGSFITINLPFQDDKVFNSAEIKEKIIPYLIEKDGLNTSCTKLYRKNLLNKNSISFPQGVALGEDGWFNFKAFNAANNVYFTSYKGYYYREVSGSATRDIGTKDYFKRALEVFHTDYHSLSSRKFSEEEMIILKGKRLIKQTISVLMIYQNPKNKLPFSKRFQYCQNIAKNKTIKLLLTQFWEQMNEDKNKFQKIILYCLKYGLFLPLWFVLQYSNYKNK